MTENAADNELTMRRRIWWIVLAILGLLLLIGLCLALGPGKALLDYVTGSSGSNQGAGPTATFTEKAPAEQIIEEATTEVPPPPPQDTPTDTAEPAAEIKPEAADTEVVSVGNGGCFAACDPANSNCLAGLVCVPGASSTGNVCWSKPICSPPTEPPCINNGVCEPDEDVSCADCIPTPQPPCACGDRVCEQERCGELAQTCPADCDVCVSNPNACQKPSKPVCGDQVCAPGEVATCEADCCPGDELCCEFYYPEYCAY